MMPYEPNVLPGLGLEYMIGCFHEPTVTVSPNTTTGEIKLRQSGVMVALEQLKRKLWVVSRLDLRDWQFLRLQKMYAEL